VDDIVEPFAGVPTTNYGWLKPIVGGDLDIWGSELNNDLDGIDSTVHSIQTSIPAASTATPLMDGTATAGVATAFACGDHVHPTDTSRYAASNPAGYQTAAQVAAVVPAPASTLPVMDGTAAIGLNALYARADHVHPSDTSRYAASNPSGYQTAAQVLASLASYAPLASPGFSGTPTAPTATFGTSTTQLATTAFVAAAIPAAYVLPTASTTVLGGVKVDGTTVTISGGVISASASGGGIADAPSDGTSYARKSAAWAHLSHADITDWAANVPAASATTPVMNGTAAIGVGTTWARADHVHPTDTSCAPIASPTFTGTVTIPAGAAISGYATTASVPVASSTTPAMNGTGAVGTGTTWARADHVHPSDTTRLPLAGGTMTGPTQLKGVTDGSDAAAGVVGEFISSVVTTGVGLTNGVVANVTSIALTAGDWDVQGEAWINPGSGCAQISAAISTVSATQPTAPGTNMARQSINATLTAGAYSILTLRPCRVSVSGTTTMYLVAVSAFTGGSTSATGVISARRVR
jgi:hypothetical protein